ncbi:MAG: SdiA-regulated domain-containing protein [Ekhidna sp.]
MKYFKYIKKSLAILLFFWIVSFTNSCDSKTFGQRADSLFLVNDNSKVFYDLKSPSEKYFLPYVLEEVSGLSFKGSNSVLAVDDESGRVFEYDLSERKISHSMTFHSADDFEGVELADSNVYVLKSDGDIFEFRYSKEKKPKTTKYENDFSKKNDTEGLGYDPVNNRLLIACKENGEVEGNKGKDRAIYGFDLTEMRLTDQPLFEISASSLEKFWEENRDFDYVKERIKFKPSAIAFNPIDQFYYVLSSVGKLLIVINQSGQIKATYPISSRVLGQPEGLCFSPSGDMYISSEGEGDRGYILKFLPKRKSK